jgi:tetratricopeptide (TPR) repeat protein
VTKLIIYKGETRYSEVALTGKAMRIGRSPENDVVLEDPGKGVSRAHAELRLEGDKYRLVDLESQNGIWVSGKRVPSVLLAPGVVAAMGPYRLAIDASSPLTQPFTPVAAPSVSDAPPMTNEPPVAVPPAAEAQPGLDPLVSDTGTEFSRPAPAPPMAVVDGPGALLDKAAPAATPAQPPAPTPAAKRAESTTVKKPAAPSTSASTARWLMFALVAIALIVASAFGAYKLVHRTPKPPVWDVAVATSLVNSGRCQEALDNQINRALQENPNDPAALALKQRCATPPPPPPVVPTPVPADDLGQRTNSQRLDDAETSLASNACQAALDTINVVLTNDPNDQRAKADLAKANACLNPSPAISGNGRAAVPVDAAAVRIAPAEGGLDPLPGEKDKDYRPRVARMKSRFNDAVATLQNQKYADALKELDAIASQVPQGYMDLAQQRAAAQAAIRAEANRAYQQGKDAEQLQQWNLAIQRYTRAHELDSRDVTADIERIKETKLKFGQQACKDAQAQYLVGHNPEARTSYQKVVELLPTNHPCYVEALQRFPDIRK